MKFKTVYSSPISHHYSHDLGGCDGCLNVNDTHNNGLADLVANLETVYQANNFSAVISR